MSGADTGGFLYSGRAGKGGVLKIGFTAQRDPGGYIRGRYAGLLDVENLMAVSDARLAESAVHHILDGYRIRGGPGRELFSGDLTPEIVQRAFEIASEYSAIGLRKAPMVRARDRIQNEDD